MRPRGQHGGGTRRVLQRVLSTLVAAAALLALSPASASALGLANLSAAPANPAAGAHSDFTIHMEFNGTGGGTQVDDLTIGLPPGLVGDPTAAPKCSQAEFDAANCPLTTAVGDVDATATILGTGVVQATGHLYNFDPQPGEPARFAIILHPLGMGAVPPIQLQSAVQLRTTDYGLTTIINNIPNKTIVDGDTTITAQTITLYGSGHGLSKPFLRNPTSCPGPHTTTFRAVPYSGATATGNASFTTPTESCENLDFSPSFSAVVGGAVGSQKTSATTSIDQDLDEAGLIKAVVRIPPELNPDASLLGNRCAPTAFLASNCPPNSVMGTAIAASPLLTQPLSGNVVLIESGGLPDIGLDLQGQLHLLLKGTLGLDKVVTFDGLPDIPIAHFALTFPSAPGLLMASRNLCDPPPPLFHADFQGYNGENTSVDSPATVVGSCQPVALTKKCKKVKKKKHKRAAEAKKKQKKRSCKKKKRKKKR
jgi:hypothetical protein